MSDPNFPKGLNIKPLDALKFGSRTSFEDGFDLQAQQDAIQSYGIAGRVWEASYPMLTYIDGPPSWSFDPPSPFKKKNRRPLSVLELGSGTGIVAARMAEILRDEDTLIVTDLPEVCPLLETNLSTHKHTCSPAVRPLAWGNSQHVQDIRREYGSLSLTHIICSDLVYFPELLAPLLRSLIHLTSRDLSDPENEATVIISYQVRSLTKESPFWSALGLWFEFYPVNYLQPPKPEDDDDDCDPDWHRLGSGQEDDVFVFIAHRRPQSHLWEVPHSDSDLLQGVGANGSATQKSDDTFETLLILSLGE